MDNKYFDFLCNVVGGALDYKQLLRKLHRIDFYSLVPNDDNREADGTRLREIFCDEEGVQHAPRFFKSVPCTMLEMLIGLSFRLEFESAQSYWEKTPDEWFWILIRNLRLDIYDDAGYHKFYGSREIDEICDRFLKRQYSGNGEGGLFPLKYPQRDQREVEIWYQMSAYILENYPL